jgi:rod shape-determining protein MreD
VLYFGGCHSHHYVPAHFLLPAMPSQLRYLALGAGLVVLQWLVLQHLSLWGATPDVVLLFLAWIALHTRRHTAAGTGFVLGAALDIAYGTWGLHMLVKTITGFLLGSIPVAEERDALLIQPQQAFLGGLMLTLMHNGLLVILLALQAQTTNSFLVNALWLGSSVYTATLGTIASALYTASSSR